MRILCFVISLFLLLDESLQSQPKQGTWELSFSSQAGSMKESVKNSYDPNRYTSEGRSFLSISVRPSYYLHSLFSVEPEILWTAMESHPPSFNLNGNVAYHRQIFSERFYGFALLGVGLGNTVPLYQRFGERTNNQFNILVLNAGLGGKYFVTENVAVRGEYRFQNYRWRKTVSNQFFINHTDFDVVYHLLLFGFSLFF